MTKRSRPWSGVDCFTTSVPDIAIWVNDLEVLGALIDGIGNSRLVAPPTVSIDGLVLEGAANDRGLDMPDDGIAGIERHFDRRSNTARVNFGDFAETHRELPVNWTKDLPVPRIGALCQKGLKEPSHSDWH